MPSLHTRYYILQEFKAGYESISHPPNDQAKFRQWVSLKVKQALDTIKELRNPQDAHVLLTIVKRHGSAVIMQAVFTKERIGQRNHTIVRKTSMDGWQQKHQLWKGRCTIGSTLIQNLGLENLKQLLGGKYDELVELRKIKFDNLASQGAPTSQTAPSSQLPPNPNIIDFVKLQALATIDNQRVRMWPPGRIPVEMSIPLEL